MNTGRRMLALGTILWSASVAVAVDNPRNLDLGPELQGLETLGQNWSHAESNWFYNAAQGSRLIPYKWFLHLEQAESSKKIRDTDNIRRLGYLPRKPDANNPDGLPIGFVKDAAYDDGTEALGLTCAACHTAQINFRGKAYLVDGAPTLGDFERLMRQLAAALGATAKENAKFERFALAVLGPNPGIGDKRALRASLKSVAKDRSDYNSRNLPTQAKDRFGPGRVDAFGAIYNEVSAEFLGIPSNAHPASAPVSYPCLWDTPQHERVQWNGAAENKTTPLGALLFGTTEVGALGRNAGEVLGVFGGVEINNHELVIPRTYDSTVNKANLIKLEDSLKKLWSPQWPTHLGEPLNQDLIRAGAPIFNERCVSCHASIDRQSPDRKVKASLWNVGTDPVMNRNFGRRGQTGKLEGRRTSLLGHDRFRDEEPIAVILKHVVERTILNPQFKPEAIRDALVNGSLGRDALNPGFRMTATIDLGGNRRAVGQFDALIEAGQSLKIEGGRFHLMDRTRDIAREGLGKETVDFDSLEGIRAAASRLGGALRIDETTAAEEGEPRGVELVNAQAQLAYKARPLNGIWATAPYLHNGSVPTLAELLKPAKQRSKQFHVGSFEFDPENVGFKDDPTQPLFDTSVAGNSNAGHEYAVDLTDEQKRQLLEYLKSL